MVQIPAQSTPERQEGIPSYNPPARGGLKEKIQIFSYRLAKPSKPIFFPKVAKSEVFFGTKEKCLSSGLEGPNSKISKTKIKPLSSAFRQKFFWANWTFLWAANRDSAKVVEKSVKSEAKYHKTAPKL